MELREFHTTREAFTSPRLAKRSITGRLLLFALYALADDDGFIRFTPEQATTTIPLKGFAADNSLEGGLVELHDWEFIELTQEEDGTSDVEILDWDGSRVVKA